MGHAMSSPSPERCSWPEYTDALHRLARIERLMREPGFYVVPVGVGGYVAVTPALDGPNAPTAWEATCKLADALATGESE